MSKCFQLNYRREQSGLSTVEVIFSLFVIGVAFVVYAASLNLVPLIKSTRHQNVAYHLALKQIEQFRNTDFSALPASGALVDSDLSLLPSGTAQLTVSEEATGLKRLTVTVSWSEAAGGKSVSLDTLIYQNGLNTL